MACLQYTGVGRVGGAVETLGVVDEQPGWRTERAVAVGDGQRPGVVRLRGARMSRWHRQSTGQRRVRTDGRSARVVGRPVGTLRLTSTVCTQQLMHQPNSWEKCDRLSQKFGQGEGRGDTVKMHLI